MVRPALTVGPEKKQKLRGLMFYGSYPENLVEFQISFCAVWEFHISICFSGLGGEVGKKKIFEVIICLMNYIIKFLKILFFFKKAGLQRVGGITLKDKFPNTEAAYV